MGTQELFASRETRGIITPDHHVFAGLLTPTLQTAARKSLGMSIEGDEGTNDIFSEA
jgi:hypothetical protein